MSSLKFQFDRIYTLDTMSIPDLFEAHLTCYTCKQKFITEGTMVDIYRTKKCPKCGKYYRKEFHWKNITI